MSFLATTSILAEHRFLSDSTILANPAILSAIMDSPTLSNAAILSSFEATLPLFVAITCLTLLTCIGFYLLFDASELINRLDELDQEQSKVRLGLGARNTPEAPKTIIAENAIPTDSGQYFVSRHATQTKDCPAHHTRAAVKARTQNIL